MAKRKCHHCEQNHNEADFTVCRSCFKDKETQAERNCRTCNQNKDIPIVINGLLAYISTYQHRSSSLQLKLAISSHYTEAEIEEAKSELIESLEEYEIPLGDATKERQNSTNRSAKEAEIDDIISIFKTVDQQNIIDRPKFCAQDLSVLPAAPPEAGGSMMSVFEVLTQQKKQIDSLTTAMTQLQVQVTNLKDQRTQVKPFNSVVADLRQAHIEAQYQGQHPPNLPGSISQQNTTKPGTSDSGPVQSSNREAVQKQQSRWRDRKKGTAGENNKLTAGPTQMTLQITNVNPEKTEDDIKQYIEKKDNTVKPIEIKDASEEGWDTKRFLVTFHTKDFDKVKADEFWPDRIYFRQWFTRGRGKKKESPNKEL